MKKSQNTVLKSAIKETWPSVTAFCRQFGFTLSWVINLINLKQTPFSTRGGYTKRAEQLAETLGYSPEELFPSELYSHPEEEDLGYSLSLLVEPQPPPDQATKSREMLEAVLNVVEMVFPRGGHILRLRFGLESYGEEFSLDETALRLGLTPERIIWLEAKAIWRLRRFAIENNLHIHLEE